MNYYNYYVKLLGKVDCYTELLVTMVIRVNEEG